MPMLTIPLILSALSPAGPTGAAGSVLATVLGLDEADEVTLDLTIQGGVGGTLDLYLQSTMQSGIPTAGSWFDVARFAQLAGGAGKIRTSVTFTRSFGGGAAAPQVLGDITASTSNIGSGVVLPQLLGTAMRLVAVAGAGTTNGAQQLVTGVAKQI